MEIEDLRHLALEDCVRLLGSYREEATPPMQEKLSIMYRDLLNDRGSFMLVGMGREYCGDKDGTIHPLAQARLKIMAYQILYNDGFNDILEEKQW